VGGEEREIAKSMLRVIVIVVPLGLDTFALSTVLGVLPLAMEQRLRIALVFAAAEGLMPAIGLLLGLPLGHALGEWASYVAGALLMSIGAWIWWHHLHESARGDKDEDDEGAKIMNVATAGTWSLVGLALSISLDELVVGFSFGLLGLPLVPVLLLIALQALVLSLAGQWIGRNVGQRLGPYTEQVVGPILCLLGAWFITAQLLGIPF
jgi:manganese efflux pump family protein